MSKRARSFITARSSSDQLYHRIAEAVQELGGDGKHVERILAEPVLSQEIAKLLIGPTNMAAGGEFRVIVNYRKSLQEMLTAAGVNIASECFTSECFPHPSDASYECFLELIDFNRLTHTPLALLKKLRYGQGPATLFELLAFIEKHCADLPASWIVAFGSPLNVPGERVCIPAFYAGRHHPTLQLLLASNAWDQGCRFLVCRRRYLHR